MVKVEIYFRKGPEYTLLFGMEKEQAGELTINDLLENYACVAILNQPDSTTPEHIFQMYQYREVLPAPGVSHKTITIGDIILIDGDVCVCCKHGWYHCKLKSIPSGNLMG